MSDHTPPPVPEADAQLAQAMGMERLRLHATILPSSIAGSLAAALALGWVMARHVPPADLLPWVLALLTALGLRLGITRVQRRDPLRHERTALWLRRHRLGFLAHGLAWACLAVTVQPSLGHEGFDVLLFGFAALTAGSLIATSFDKFAALAFALPTLALPTLHLFRDAEGSATGMGLVLGLFVVFTWLSTLRANGIVQAAVQARLDAQARAEEAQRHATAAESARSALAEQHHLMAQLMQNTRQGYWFIDNNGMTTDVNPAMCELMGRRRDDVVGRSVFEFFSGSDLIELHDQLERRRQGAASGYEIHLQRPDGTRVPCFNHATPIHDVRGERVGSVGLWTDLRPTKATEHALRTYEVVANSISDSVSVVDEDGTYRMVNDAWCRTAGIAREAAIGRRGEALLPGIVRSSPRVEARQRCLAENRPVTLRGSLPLPGLEDRCFETTYYPYLAPGTRSVVIVTRDVTDAEQARQALEASTEYLAATLNATADGIFASDAADPQQPIRFVNRQLLALWGIPEDRASTLTPAGVMAHAMPLFTDAAAEQQRIERIVRDNLADESRLMLRDGRVLLRRCTVSQVHGQPLRVWSFRDITAEERATQALREREAEVRQLLEAFPGHIAAIDEAGRYVYVNAKFASTQGRPAEDIVGRPLEDVVGEERAHKVRAELPRLREEQTLVSEKHYPATPARPAKDLELTWVAGPRRADGVRLYFNFAIDVTARKQAEAALVAARDEAERAHRAKSQFLSQMSHELRTPMNAIIGFGQLLENDPSHPLPPTQRDYVREILRGGHYLLNLINEVLDLGRVEAGRLEVDQSVVPLQPLLEAGLNLMRPLAMERGVALPDPNQLACPHRVLADRIRLKQVLLNLLSNAVKYNRSGGTVGLSVRAEGEAVVIEVSDQGRGLSEAQQVRLFQPFERLDADRAGIEGTGIGLALSKRLVEMMDGRIGVRSEPGQGSTFWVRLPHAVRSTEPAPLHTAYGTDELDGAPRPEHTVLYIEDNPVNTVLMEAMIARIGGVRLITAALPRAGLVLARQAQPALILLDINLPGMDGYEVLRHLRTDRRTAGIPVVAVSAAVLDEDLEAGRAAGFADYLPKPLDMQQLQETVRRLLVLPSDPMPPAPAVPA